MPPIKTSTAGLSCDVTVPQNWKTPLKASPRYDTIISIALTNDPSEPLPVALANVSSSWRAWQAANLFLGSDDNLVQGCHSVSALVPVRPAACITHTIRSAMRNQTLDHVFAFRVD